MINKNREENKLWNGFIGMADKFKYAYDIRSNGFRGSVYELRDEFNNVRYKAIIWFDEYDLCSIHGTIDNIILNTNNKRKSSKMSGLLIKNRYLKGE